MTFQLSLFGAMSLILMAGITEAQEQDLGGRISVELNAVETIEGNCKLTFLVTSGLEVPIDQLVYEAVLFGTHGKVDRLTLFDFGSIPPARPRVRQFVVPQLECEQLGRVLFNGASVCEGEGVEADICEAGLLPSSRTNIEVVG
jgi:hypothetical protein